MHKVRFWFILVPFLLLLGPSAVRVRAQQNSLDAVGIPAFTTMLPVEHGYINTANGALHLEIPMADVPVRAGKRFKAALMYDSNIWDSLGLPDNVPGEEGQHSLGGWRVVTSADAGRAGYNVIDTYCNFGSSNFIESSEYKGWYYIAPDGTTKFFGIDTIEFFPNKCTTASGTSSGDSIASDGSGYHMYVTNYKNAAVYAPDGTLAYKDTNGNYGVLGTNYWNSCCASGQIFFYSATDALGRTIITPTGSGNNIVYFDVLNSQGTTSRYTLTTETIDVNPVTGFNSNTPLPITVVQSIQLPDGTSYSFGYDNGTTVGHWGMLTSMTMPTGNTITYSYADTNLPFAAQYPPGGGPSVHLIATRVTPDSTIPWKFAYQLLASCNGTAQYQLTVTKPSGDNEVYLFVGTGDSNCSIAEPTQLQIYNGPVSAANLVATFTQTFPSYPYPCAVTGTNTGVPLVLCNTLAKLADTVTLPLPNGTSVNRTNHYTWDNGGPNGLSQYGQLLKKQEWNFGSNTSGNPDRTTTYTYWSDTHPAYFTANILNRIASEIVTNSTGATIAQTTYCYDYAGGCGGSSFISGVVGSCPAVTGSANHDDTNYGAANTVRGDVTQIQRYTGANYLSASTTYDITGQIRTSTDAAGNTTTYCDADSFVNGSPSMPTNAYPTTITNALNQPTRNTYYYGSGHVQSTTDPNQQTTTFSYDGMERLTATNYPDGGQTSLGYNYNGSVYTGATSTKKVDSSQNLATTDNVDGLGRLSSRVTTSDPDGPTTVNTVYDSNSRLLKVSNPYRSTSDETYGSEINSAYDGLDRVLQVTHADGHISSIYYGQSVGAQGGATSQLCAPGTYGIGYPVLKIDEANNKLQSWIDGFGRTIEVDEPTATSASLSANTCYSYDLNNNLIGVLAAGGVQTRSFIYDELSRLTQAANPETGGSTTPTIYNYDADTNCAAPNSFPGDLVSHVDARGIRTCMQYDALHRLTAKTHSDGTPAKYYSYDVAPSWMTDLTNVVGRLVEARNQFSGTTGSGTSTVNSYDAMGRVIRQWQQTPPIAPGGNFLYYGYDLLGDMTSYTNGAGVTLTQAFNAAARLTGITSSLSDTNQPPNHPATLLTNVHYNALGEPISATLGNGAVETRHYAPRGWPLTASVVSQSTGTPGQGTVTINGSEQSYTNPPQNTSAGPNTASASADSRSGGTLAWGSTGSGGGQAIFFSSGSPTFATTNYLNITNAGFNLPSTTTSINGIQVVVTRHMSSTRGLGVTSDAGVFLLKAGAQAGTGHGIGSWGSTASATYGSSTDTWGTSWTFADINANNFGLAFAATLRAPANISDVATVGSIQITVWYTYQNGTTYDSGSVTVTVNGSSTPPVQYSNGNGTAVSIAGQLASEISAFGFVTASNKDTNNNPTNVITIKSTSNGTSTNYPLSGSSQSSAGFNPPSFTTALSNVSPCGSASCMTGGTGAPGTLYSFSLGYTSGNSNVTSAIDNINGTWSFTYDYLNRLSTANQNNGVNICSFGYDQLGNRTSQTATAGSCNGNLSLSYSGNNNRMDGYSYDAAGNLLGDGLHTYAYDAENRLVSVDNGNTASYVYDAEGRRVQKKTTAQVEYLYDLDGNIVTELSSTGAWNRGEIFANGQHLATYNNGTTYFDHSDWLGTERTVSNMADAFCERIGSLPFGDGQLEWAFGYQSCFDVNPLHFTGQQRDAESSLDYFGARNYSSQFGRFMTPDWSFDPDPVPYADFNDPQTLNLYSYVRNNPLTLTDADGHSCTRDKEGNFFGDCSSTGDELVTQSNQSQTPVRVTVSDNELNLMMLQSVGENLSAPRQWADLVKNGLELTTRTGFVAGAMEECALSSCSKANIALALMPGLGDLKALGIAAHEEKAIAGVLKQIAAGSTKGAEYLNWDGKLPAQAAGYYRRFTVPLAGQLGRGTARLVAGLGGEIYYTADEYANFIRIR